MITLYTHKTLDRLTWKEIQKLHKSLGLKASPNARTRRDLQNNIVAAMPQPVVEPEHVATPLTCSVCPFARLIEDNRYCCGLSDVVVRGHWEAKADCYDAVADAAQPKPENEGIEPAAQKEAPILREIITKVQSELASVQTIKTLVANHPFRYRHDIYNGQHSFSSAMYGLCECTECTAPQSSKPEIEPEGTIHWHSPSTGTITGKKGALRNFYISSNDEIMIVISANFTASERKSPNIRHKQIRAAIESGRDFNPRAFKSSPSFKNDTKACNGGRIRQECDGRWWAWRDNGVTGHPFHCESQALQYLARVSANNVRKQVA